MRILSFLFVFELFFSTTLSAQWKSDEDFSVHGFYFLYYQYKKSLFSRSESREHFWLNVQKRLSHNVRFNLTLTPFGPPRIDHNWELLFQKPLPGVDLITLGRSYLYFSQDLFYRRDRVPTVNFSNIDNRINSRDIGIQVHGSVSQFKWSAGVFVGDRSEGSVPDSLSGPDIYSRLTYNLSDCLQIGSGFRYSRINAYELDVRYKTRRTLFSGEMIYSGNVLEGYVLGQYGFRFRAPCVNDIIDFSIVSRIEFLRYDRQYIYGVSFLLWDHELKINHVVSDNNPSQYVARLVFRW